MLPALLKWIGNKQRFAETIVGYMPSTFSNYYEPFLGSGAVLGELLLRERERSVPAFERAYASDILPYLVDIFAIVKDRPDAIIDHYNEEITRYYADPVQRYEAIRDRFTADRNALDFCLLSRTCYSGVIRFRKADGYMSTPRGPHKPISPDAFEKRVRLWSSLIQKAEFATAAYQDVMDRPMEGDVVYCDPPYTHSQGILYGAQGFRIEELWGKIEGCKRRGAKVMLSLNWRRESEGRDISIDIPDGLFAREVLINCGVSMIDRLQNAGGVMRGEGVQDKLLMTW